MDTGYLKAFQVAFGFAWAAACQAQRCADVAQMPRAGQSASIIGPLLVQYERS
ncbi:hypothetical protein HMPREF9371_1467 [Neisseria shayeganii 871]|uniref:Uncharacterized protein n=1 Tax=Neisseria shayeganii 871 TaxID=1032488 RepID=G4CIM8_9NEIS|nr:hypothetical protein HMPREF9371_1467 [Neisseria shayeganii 871]